MKETGRFFLKNPENRTELSVHSLSNFQSESVFNQQVVKTPKR